MGSQPGKASHGRVLVKTLRSAPSALLQRGLCRYSLQACSLVSTDSPQSRRAMRMRRTEHRS